MRKRDIKRRAILETAYRLFRTQGFDKTSVSQITAEVGGSKATIYNHFPSKEVLFVECMTTAADDYIAGIVDQSIGQLDNTEADPSVVLRDFGTAFLNFVCSPDMVAARRLMIAEAARSGIGKLFFDKITTMRMYVALFLSNLMETGVLHPGDPQIAAEHLRALLEAELLEPLMLQARDNLPDEKEIATAADRAVAAFLRAYVPAESLID
ncbi:TetR/AcrR family transcriptional regulator [Mariprofundus erugo]|uniref:TetR/AcrR family transcriptional regulator n=1 Tax=Mariprofundus erugo TaxID=2528639 RepID=UPI0010FE023C|nr:TetR/AcrR family transcriptional regulator [Mariprofundus erugo]TLS75091.1 TetR/AcrR family transcriptional regulator [Mariprofundus erugo]